MTTDVKNCENTFYPVKAVKDMSKVM